MSPADFPTRLADLTLNDASLNPSLYASLRSIRKSTLSITNRLNSVLADAKFAKQVSEHYQLPLVANERCGSWYIEPRDKVGSAYFKSTDGHHGQWDFSLRRLNLQLLPLLGQHGGAIVVDSTRRGKNLPDAFSKTVPIWVAVINRVLFPELPSTHSLQHPPPPDDLGLSEISQIEARLAGFARSFKALGLDAANLRNQLKCPIRIEWAINGRFTGEDEFNEAETGDNVEKWNHLVLCSASRRVHGAEVSEGGYIQGAGDDHEGWAHGLTAQLFWKYKDELLQTPEADLPSLIEELLGRCVDENAGGSEFTRIDPTSNIHIKVGPASGLDAFDLIINCEGDVPPSTRQLDLKCRSGKLGSKDLRDKLGLVTDTVRAQLNKNKDSQILVTCSNGKDLSAGVAVAILCLFYDDKGRVREDNITPSVDKQLVKQRLAWITYSKADVNPSRATLQAVNYVLMQRPD
ncbi:tRNA A64-2'-O-ribosylphosphate transferase [Exophiala dermatitidis]|uniref:Initiator tRNA phosphoribosyl transferase n=1 Tax=Exophiala dermatitidis (strain ATCC 34100 / CBS 525.76 / NIH/UT8656) TaxID=858893 RepID=H6C7Z6_EXODN|nr:initiator tRNA phosphoribosyl transferase [Exophiala dermatitidis NIH/UT8656]EHY60223.1 initiator tRNA phosphoribosyl transferase [Exophiala dermatitidis NIH/UT8656]